MLAPGVVWRNAVWILLSFVAVSAVGWATLASAAEGPAVTPLDGSTDAGDLAGLTLADEVVGMAATPSGGGYWLVATDGGVFAFGDAAFHGSTGDIDLDRPIVGMAATPTGLGYWLVASDGGVFTFGDAAFHGSMGGTPLAQPVVGMAATPSGLGYWLVAADGGVFTFGDATFHGSTGALTLAEPITAMASTSSGAGYWMLARDGGVFTFGDATFHGAGLDPSRRQDAMAIGADPAGGYWILSGDGHVMTFGPVSRDPSPDPVCQRDAVRGGVVGSTGAWWYTTSVDVPLPGFTSSATGIDGASIKEQLAIAQACQQAVAPTSADFVRPTTGPVSSNFGLRIHPIWGFSILHAGADVAAPTGTTVVSAAAGSVVAVDQRSAYGLTVVIDHGGRVGTVYAHLATAAVSPGDVVGAGEPIGTVGSSGFVTGAHLHVEVRLDGDPINPAPLLGL